MRDNHASLLRRIAEQAMLDRGFLLSPPPEALAEIAAEAPAPPPGARDLRGMPWTSIDNADSRDLDQIEAVEATPRGTRLYVGIADVNCYVAAGSATDAYARENGTSVYTGVVTFSMLPEALSFDRSSLLPARPRLAMIIETLVREDGTTEGGEVYPALVENHAKLDYPSVSAWLDGKAAPPGALASNRELREQVERQDALARVLGHARRAAGALDVDTAEIRPVVDAGGGLSGLAVHHQDRAGRVIEELMIASNRTVAATLDRGGLVSLRRVVRQPERWAAIVRYAALRGFPLPEAPDSLALAKFVDAMRAAVTPDEFGAISLALVKLMGRGEYAVHCPGKPDIGHFGLATSVYTHATAPNRRYPDLVTQRLVRSLGRPGSSPYGEEELGRIAAHCTQREADAQKVERRVRKSIAATILSSRVGQTFKGVVTGASPKGTYVRVSAPPVEGKIVRGHEGLEVGDPVQVRLRDVSVPKGFIDFEVS